MMKSGSNMDAIPIEANVYKFIFFSLLFRFQQVFLEINYVRKIPAFFSYVLFVFHWSGRSPVDVDNAYFKQTTYF